MQLADSLFPCRMDLRHCLDEVEVILVVVLGRLDQSGVIRVVVPLVQMRSEDRPCTADDDATSTADAQ